MTKPAFKRDRIESLFPWQGRMILGRRGSAASSPPAAALGLEPLEPRVLLDGSHLLGADSVSAVTAASVEVISVAPDGAPANSSSQRPELSADGRFVAYYSEASNLVPGDTNEVGDIFVFDRQERTTERVSVASDGSQANGSSFDPFISADGRFVAFESEASNLVPGDTNEAGDIFVFDRQERTTERVSVASDGSQANHFSADPSLSADGRFVVFGSQAWNMVPGHTVPGIFVFDRQERTTERVSVASDGSQANENSWAPFISADGRFVAFESGASNLVPGDTNEWSDVFVFDREERTTERVSVASDGSQANNFFSISEYPVNGNPHISTDGRFVVYYSQASNLVPGDTNREPDVFVFDRQDRTTERVSVASDGSQANRASRGFHPDISGDGRFVTFASLASNLVRGDTNNASDVFVFDRQERITERVSVASDGWEANGISAAPSMSADGRLVAFHSGASNLVPGQISGVFRSNIFIVDREAQEADSVVTRAVVIAPSAVRRDREFSFMIDLYNPSPEPAPAQRLTVSLRVPFGQSPGDYSLGTSHTFLTDVLPPGRTTLTFWAYSDNEPGDYTVSVTRGEDPTARPDDWAVIHRPASYDPNDITGPAGVGPQNHVDAADLMPYLIRFENDAERATAPAAMVTITQTLDADLDWTTFRLSDVGFGSTFVDVPDDVASFETRVDLTDTRGVYVDVRGGIDAATGEVRWEFVAIDPETGELPEDPLVGFLPPNVNGPEGEGFVTYTVLPKQTVVTGDRVDAVASIVFDVNEPIITPAIFHTFDIEPGSSQVDALPATTDTTSFTVTWSGEDAAGGSGIGLYDVYMSTDGGEYTLWRGRTADTSATFVGEAGRTYEFYSVARDNVGHVEAAPHGGLADAQTTVATGFYQDVALGAAGFRRVTYTEGDGTVVNIGLSRGAGTLYFAGEGIEVASTRGVARVSGQNVLLQQVALAETTLRSTLAIRARGGDDGLASVGVVNGSRPLGRLVAPEVDLVGDGIVLSGDGVIQSVRVHDLRDGADIVMPGVIPGAKPGVDRGAAVVAARLAEGTDLSLGGGLRRLRVADWGDGTLTAPWAGKLAIVGESARSLAGDLGADVLISGAAAPRGQALASLVARGWLDGASIRVGGNVGSVSAVGLRDARVFAGVDSDVTGLPGDTDGFELDATLRALTVRGQRGDSGPYFVNASVVANTIGKLKIREVDLANGGAEFGVAANRIGSYKRWQGGKQVQRLRLLDDPVDFAPAGELDREDDYVGRIL